MSRSDVRGTALFVLLAVVASVIAARARYTTDLSAFFREKNL